MRSVTIFERSAWRFWGTCAREAALLILSLHLFEIPNTYLRPSNHSLFVSWLQTRCCSLNGRLRWCISVALDISFRSIATLLRLRGSVVEALLEVGDDVINMLRAYRDSNQVFGDTAGETFFFAQLLVGGRPTPKSVLVVNQTRSRDHAHHG